MAKTISSPQRAYDGYGYQNLEELQNTLCLLFVAGLSMLFGAGYLLARTSLKPIRDIVSEAERITASEISRRLPVKNRNDELGELSTTFNSLLERLEVSFNAQKMFVSNVSHEMRTPLARTDRRTGSCLAEGKNARTSTATL